MLQNRTWVDPKAEADFWKQMERLETVNARLGALGRWEGLLRRAALQRDLDAIRIHAQDLVDRHTVPADATGASPAAPAASPADTPLRTLAGMVVSLRQDRASRSEAGEEKAG
ncbi:hypothetical protein D3218_04315 [Aureimonas flava]|uniref:Uncharacterized protein n=1 Tax=Aureimonas flava TaxID=2320271 RepID=A0A3A1WPC7_9HYPH|nr:hypothetical protein [Aureimonas flava]RIY02595.1 hypothetical protein D3218_04315 [Aureimonas flava]